MTIKIKSVIKFILAISLCCTAFNLLGEQIDWRKITNPDEGKAAVITIDQFTARHQEIFKQVIAVNGKIDEPLHSEFWSTVPWSIVSGKKGKEELTFLKELIKLGGEYQKELWLCAMSSYKNNKITKTDRLDQLHKSYIKRLNEQSFFIKDSALFQQIIEKIKYNSANSDLLLKAAATHQQWSADEKGIIDIDQALIQTILNGIPASIERVTILMTPKYYYSVTWRQAEEAVRKLDHLSLKDKKIAFSIVEIKVHNNYDGVEKTNFNSSNPEDIIWALKVKGFHTAKLQALAKRLDWPEMSENYFAETKAIMAIVNKKIEWNDYQLMTKKIIEERRQIRNQLAEPLKSGPFTLDTTLYEPTNKIAMFIAAIAKWNA